MARNKGTFTFAANFQVKAAEALENFLLFMKVPSLNLLIKKLGLMMAKLFIFIMV